MGSGLLCSNPPPPFSGTITLDSETFRSPRCLLPTQSGRSNGGEWGEMNPNMD
jgi:hypothetical protein